MEAQMAKLSNLVTENATKKDPLQANNQVRCFVKLAGYSFVLSFPDSTDIVTSIYNFWTLVGT